MMKTNGLFGTVIVGNLTTMTSFGTGVDIQCMLHLLLVRNVNFTGKINFLCALTWTLFWQTLSVQTSTNTVRSHSRICRRTRRNGLHITLTFFFFYLESIIFNGHQNVSMPYRFWFWISPILSFYDSIKQNDAVIYNSIYMKNYLLVKDLTLCTNKKTLVYFHYHLNILFIYTEST